MKILMVVTSHDTLGTTGQKTGFWLEEFAAPYYVFTDAGAEVTVASPSADTRRSIPRAISRSTRPRPWPDSSAMRRRNTSSPIHAAFRR